MRTLINYQFVSCDPFIGVYEYEVPAYAMASPYYDVVLSFAEEPNLTQPFVPLGSGSIPSGLSVDDESIAAVYEVGEPITGKCQILGINGLPKVTSYIRVHLYSIDLSTRPVTNVLIDHWVVRCASGTSIYMLEIATNEFTPGDYKIRLGFEDGTVENLRIRLVARE